jgi:hypothetical protein
MLSHLFKQMDEYLSNKPFIRRWWSRRWIVHMTIQPPLSKDYPLWKRSKDELRLLRLFDLSPEELGQKIDRYWKKPRWRRWFASFGMNKKIDVWNYYQRCLAYQEISQDKLRSEQSLVTASERKPILEDLVLILHQANVKFETYLEKRCRNSKWIEKNYSEEVKRYMQGLKKTFLTKLNKHLKQIETGEERLALKQQAEKEYQEVEVLMFHYYHRWHFNAFSSRPEVGIDIVNDRAINKNQERRVDPYTRPQTISSSFAPVHRIIAQDGIGSLDEAKKWIQAQREHLKSMLKDGSLQKVEELLQTSLNEIKTITELHLGCCESKLSNIQGRHEAYDDFIKYLDDLQRRLKPLLQGGMLLFHPDHMRNLTHSQEMWEMITRYSQSYLEQSRYYLDSLKNYHLRIEELYQHSHQELQRQQALQDWSDLARRIQELGQSIKELEQLFKELEKKRTEDIEKFKSKLNAQWEKDEAEFESKRVQDKAEADAKLAQKLDDQNAKFEAKLTQDKAEMDAKLKEVEFEIRAHLKAKHAAENPINRPSF